jgi:hydroxymethylbilane synthase
VQDNDWSSLFCSCELERINLKPENYINWVDDSCSHSKNNGGFITMQEDAFTLDALSQLNDIETEIVTISNVSFLKLWKGLYGF